ncbi:acyltransferase family protein [Pelagovum pacificum]|nr:acyltransferase [Pelagovum pacificum]
MQLKDVSSKNFSLALHGARGLFSLMVLLYHLWNSGLSTWVMPAPINELLYAFRFGVELFFAVSGYVIVRSVARAASPAAFLRDRATRIYPVLWVAVLVFLPLGILDSREEILRVLEPPALLVLATVGNMLALPPVLPVPLFYPPAWTLGLEAAFYACCAAWLALRPGVGRMLVLVVGLCLIWWHPRAAFFLCGVAVALFPRTSGRHWTLLWLLVFLWAWSGPLPPGLVEVRLADWSSDDWLRGLIAAGAVTIMIGGIVNGSGPLSTWLRRPTMMWLGTVSYSLYLWHPIVLGVVKEAMYRTGLASFAGPAAMLVLAIVVVPVSLVVAEVSHRLLEVRLTRWLRRSSLTPWRAAE